MVDLPLPLVPTSAQLLPAGTRKETPCAGASGEGRGGAEGEGLVWDGAEAQGC